MWLVYKIELTVWKQIFSYRQNAARISRIFRDRPQHPLDTAVYWVEYVLKYDGARHLRSPAHGLAWYQYLLLDVALFVAIFIYLIVLSVLYIYTKFVQLIRMKPKITIMKYYGGKKVDWKLLRVGRRLFFILWTN